MSLTASVVICAYTLERWDDLRRSVDSVLGQIPAPNELVIVTDHNQELFTRCRSIYGERVRPNGGPRGLSGARNTGLEAATGDIVLFLDDDAAAEPGWLFALMSVFGDPEVIGAGGPVLAEWDARRPRWFPPEFDWVVGCSYIGLPEQRAPIRNPIGASMAFRRSAMTSLGGFRTSLGRGGGLPTGAEETDLSIRTAQRWPTSRILFVPEAVVRHRVRAARGRLSYFLRRCLGEGYSKAVLARLVGVASGTASERSYVRRTILAGLAGYLRSAVAERRPDRLLSAAAILIGLATTGLGFAIGALATYRRQSEGEADRSGLNR